jgi:hypothetical protein
MLPLLLSSMVYIQETTASTTILSLPTRSVTIETFNGTASFFITELSNVPSGYVIANKSYPGWCVDRTAEMARSPATHLVTLYSSLNISGDLANQTWDMVNYLLNHKQGDKLDVQNALWYFVNMQGSYTDFKSDTAWSMVNDTLAHGKDFVPSSTQVAAVICYPVRSFATDANVQISIIEVPVDASSSQSSTGDQNGTTNYLSPTNLFIIAVIVVIAAIIALSALLFLRRSKKRN